MKTKRTCRYCLHDFIADVDPEGNGQEVCGPCDAAFDEWLTAKLDEVTEDLVAEALNWCHRTQRARRKVLATIDSLDVA